MRNLFKKKSLAIFTIAAFLVGGFFITNRVNAADWNVNNDSTTGTSCISNSTFNSIQLAVDNASDGDTIYIAAGTYELPSQLIIKKPITIIGIGSAVVTITPAKEFNKGTQISDQNLISINAVNGLVKLENLTITKSIRSGINIWESANVVLNEIISTENSGTGLIVNNSYVTATNYNSSKNVWGYGVNVDNGSNPSSGAPLTVFKLISGTILDDIQIKSDKNGVQVISDSYKPYTINGSQMTIWTNGPLTNVATISKGGINTIYTSIQDAVDAANNGDTINIAKGTYKLSKELDISRPISVIGNGNVILKAKNVDVWGADNGKKHLVAIHSGTASSTVNITNITLDASGTYGLNTYNNAYGILNNVTIKNSKGAGLTVNGSTVEATNLNTDLNSWGDVNVDPGDGVTTPSIFTLTDGLISKGILIYSDGKNVTATTTVEVKAVGYDNKRATGYQYWVKVASNVKNITELKAALADMNIKTINITANISGITEALNANHAVTINGGGKTLTFTSALNILGGGLRQGILVNVKDSKIINLSVVMAGETGWQGVYGIQVNNAEVTLNDVTTSGADGGILINGSAVELTGTTTVSGNEFGGIEVSKGTGLLDSVLTVTGTLVNGTEAYKVPTIWLVNGQGSVTGTISTTTNTTIKVDQTQYYLTAANASLPVVITPAAPSYGGGGGSYSSVCSAVTYGEWGTCINGMQYRNVLTQTPYSCTLTSAQELIRSQACGTAVVTPIATSTEIITPVVIKQVLGEKKYADGTLVRVKGDSKIFVYINGVKHQIRTLAELKKYAGREILNITADGSLTQVLGVKTFANGSLLRGSDKKVYILIKDKLKHVRSLVELRKYAGHKINDVANTIISGYEMN